MPDHRESIGRISARMFEPLCENSAKLFKSRQLKLSDHVWIGEHADPNYFTVRPFGRDITDDHGMTRTFSASREAVAVIQGIPVAERMGYDMFKVQATDVSALIVNHAFPPSRVSYSSNEVREAFEYLLYRFAAQTQAARIKAEYVHDGKVPELDFIQTTPPLSGYQIVPLATGLGFESLALFMEQGTGKTPPTIALMNEEAARFTGEAPAMFLVVCPKNVKSNWRNEIERFSTRRMFAQVLEGWKGYRDRDMISALAKTRDEVDGIILIISYEVMVRSLHLLKVFRWNRITLDEAHCIKDWRTSRCKAALELRDYAYARSILTGTPVCNRIGDLWSQLEFLGRGQSGFVHPEDFSKFYEVYDEDPETGEAGFYKRVVGLQNLPILHERLARVGWSVKKKQVLPDLPPKTYDVIDVEMGKEQTAAYEMLQEQLAMEIEETLASSKHLPRSVTINNILVKLLKLAQVTSGFIKCDDVRDAMGKVTERGQVRHFKEQPKLDALKELIKGLGPDDKAIVWATFIPNVYAISAMLVESEIDHVIYTGQTDEDERTRAVERFNGHPSCKVFVGNPAAGGVGLNLLGYKDPDAQSTNCSLVVYYSSNWSYAQRAQSEDRANRRGTRVPVRYVDLMVPETVDEQIFKKIRSKVELSDSAKDLAEVLKKVLGIEVSL